MTNHSPPASLTTPHFKSLLDQCVHCGLCLPACPTYAIDQTEMDGPRGRILLMNAAADGRIDLQGSFQQHIEQCLGCRACETACPSGVQYGELFEIARTTIADEQPNRGIKADIARATRWFTLRQLLAKPQRLHPIARLLRIYQAIGLSALLRRVRLLPHRLRTMEALLPPLSAASIGHPTTAPAPAIGQKRGTVALLLGCVQDAFLGDVNAATVRVLQRNGYEVHFPKHQSCCGAAPLHIGQAEIARDMARQNIEAFATALGGENGEGAAEDGYIAIINNAGGCGATLKEYGHLLADDPTYAARAKKFAAKVQDIGEFLAANLHVPPTGKIEETVTYVESCHLRHAQGIIQQPRQLLAAIPGLTLIELKTPEICCGSAGVYNILQPEMADEILDAKMDDVAATAASIIVTTNAGCQMQMIRGVREQKINAQVLHLVQLLDQAYTI